MTEDFKEMALIELRKQFLFESDDKLISIAQILFKYHPWNNMHSL